MGMIIRDTVNYTHGGNANYVEVTQAEYDALSPAKKNNGTMYFITDAPDDTTIAPIIYSEEEREVGVWRDGKPLYEKTVDCGYLPNRTTKSVSFGVNNIDKVLHINGIAYSSVGHSLPLPYCDDASYTGNILVDATSNGIVRFICQADRSLYYGYVTIRYTKTTDTPGSGKWAPSGVPAIHYSTEEQVVGEWIDGSTIYERTFKIDNPTSTVNPSTLVNLTNNEVVIDIQGYLEASDGTRLYNNFGDSTDYQLKLWFEVGAIKYRAKCGSSSLTEITFTIRYTKSS